MPIAKIFLYGKLPADLDLSVDGEPFGVCVHHRSGTIWMDMSDIELDKIVADNQFTVDEAMSEFTRGKIEWDRRLAKEMRDGK
jgi:hypothetical protein